MTNKVIGGIVFDSDFAYSADVSSINHIFYKIRLANTKRRFLETFGESFEPWDTVKDFKKMLVSGPNSPKDIDGGSPGRTIVIFFTITR